MKSKFNSWCVACKGKIAQGDEIEKIDGRWVHAPPCPTKKESKPLEQKPRGNFVPSPYQEAIFDFVKNGSGNAVVEAVAGSGKTTTLVEGLSYTNPKARVIMVAFNKPIADNISQILKSRNIDWVTAKTLHSLGYANLRRAFGKVQVQEDKLQNIIEHFIPFPPFNAGNEEKAEVRAEQYALKHLVSLAKATLVDPRDHKALQELVDHYSLEINGDAGELFNLLPKVLQECMSHTKEVDFDDMLWLPVILNIQLEQFDWVFVDETQDLNFGQIEFVLRSVKPGGRVIAVGDSYQSIYGFRGADITAMPRLVKVLNAKTLPLSISYRCPRLHIELAQEIVKEIQSRDNAPDGLIDHVTIPTFQQTVRPGDMVLCRINAPLVTEAFGLIRQGVKAIVRGKDIGRNLQVLLRKMDAPTVDEVEEKIRLYRDRELNRLFRRNAPESKIDSVNDTCDTMLVIVAECEQDDGQSLQTRLQNKVETLFSDDVEGVVLSSVHRAKGLEADRVFILRPELLPMTRKEQQEWEHVQEQNIKYVSLTRSKSELYFVK